MFLTSYAFKISMKVYDIIDILKAWAGFLTHSRFSLESSAYIHFSTRIVLEKSKILCFRCLFIKKYPYKTVLDV